MYIWLYSQVEVEIRAHLNMILIENHYTIKSQSIELLEAKKYDYQRG